MTEEIKNYESIIKIIDKPKKWVAKILTQRNAARKEVIELKAKLEEYEKYFNNKK